MKKWHKPSEKSTKEASMSLAHDSRKPISGELHGGSGQSRWRTFWPLHLRPWLTVPIPLFV